MSDQERPRRNPDILLEDLKREKQGKLTVFLGASAGVGKTYAMLEAAGQKLRDGEDIAIGWIQTHGRQETDRLLEGLPIIEPKTLEYRGKFLQEMDLDAVIQRHPAIILVDELAHTNVPGSRFVRRYQDVEEILQAGIDVYTTVNIQHIESLNDVVAQITGVIVRETVPDYILEQADSIRLIDITPEELTKRLKEGKVYITGQVERALKGFFRKGNLNALRELALRFTAMQVEQAKNKYMYRHSISGPWATAGRVLVCVSSSPFSAQLIRAAKRLADGLQIDFLAVNIRQPASTADLDPVSIDRLNRNMRLAEELGAKTMTIVGDNLIKEIINVAVAHNVTSIVVGKTGRSLLWRVIHGSFVDNLIKYSKGMNVYVIQGRLETDQPAVAERVAVTEPAEAHAELRQFSLTVAGVLGISAFCWSFQNLLNLTNMLLLYLLPVLMSATWWGRKPSYLAAVLGVLLYDFLFVPPTFTFVIADITNILSLFIFMIVSFVIGKRTERLLMEAHVAKQREVSLRNVHEFSTRLATTMDKEFIANELAKGCAQTMHCDITVLLPDEEDKLRVAALSEGTANVILPDSEYAVATWSYTHGQTAGYETQVLSGAKYRFVPLISADTTRGVIGLFTDGQKISPESAMLMNAWTSLAALALERVDLVSVAKKEALMSETDKLRNTILNSLSHELKTPLAAISGAAATLLEERINYGEKAQQELLKTIKEGSRRMERVIANLLDSTRFESGSVALKLDWCDLEDTVGVALRQLKEATTHYKIKTHMPEDLPFIRADAALLEHVFLNLLDNAMKYSVLDSEIELGITFDENNVLCTVHDNGIGMPANVLKDIFNKFFRVTGEITVGGTGLGLYICKNIIKAHGGRIWAESKPGEGSTIFFTLPRNIDNAKMDILVE